MSTERYDDLVLGSGAGGKLLSWHLARAGRRTAVVERRYIGGSCPNINCLPSKNEVWSAKVADLIHHAAAFGVVTGSTAIDMRRVALCRPDPKTALMPAISPNARYQLAAPIALYPDALVAQIL